MIEVKNVSKIYNENGVLTPALREASFKIIEGDFVSIMGPSGSGKSTLLHILSFMDRPTSGDYQFLGKRMSEMSDIDLAKARNSDMGFIFQSFNLLSRASVYENVELPLIYSGLDRKNRAKKISEAVNSVGLEEKMWTEVARLSGGQKQRVAIARALVNSPKVIFADEPTGNLDSVSGEQVMEILKDLNKKGKTIILVTHETYTASYGKRLIKIHDGKIVYDGPNAVVKGEYTK